jgi:hypothetical protein
VIEEGRETREERGRKKKRPFFPSRSSLVPPPFAIDLGEEERLEFAALKLP